MAGMMSMKTHLKGVLAFRGVLYLAFLFILDIWHDVQNGLGSTLRSMYFQKKSISLASSNLVYPCPNIWCNNSKYTFFFRNLLLWFWRFLHFLQKCMFICDMWVNVTELCSLSLKKTVQNHLWKRQVRPEFINVIMENNWSHNSDANSKLYNLARKSFPLSSHILFELLLSVSIWKNSHLKLWYIYLFLPTIPV